MTQFCVFHVVFKRPVLDWADVLVKYQRVKPTAIKFKRGNILINYVAREEKKTVTSLRFRAKMQTKKRPSSVHRLLRNK